MSNAGQDHDHWARAAQQWIAWARTPGHDEFWAYRNALCAFIGSGRGAVALDLGCGEGRVARELTSLGYVVTTVDPVEDLVRAAAGARSARHYAFSSAAALPFESASFDMVIAYNMLMDIENVPAAIREARRVLRPAGTLIVSVVHPWIDRGRFEGPGEDAPFVVRGSYFGRLRFEGTDERNGLRMDWAGWSQPLEAYAAALEGAGFAITSLREPQPDLDGETVELRQWTRLPLFIWLKARPLAP